MQILTIITDGLFSLPYTSHDWIILVLAFCGYIYRMYLWHKVKDVKNPELRDWVGMFVLIAMMTIGLYELALAKKWEMKLFFLPFALAILLAKDVTDWLFMSREGRSFVIKAFKDVIAGVFEKFGYVRKTED